MEMLQKLGAENNKAVSEHRVLSKSPEDVPFSSFLEQKDQ